MRLSLFAYLVTFVSFVYTVIYANRNNLSLSIQGSAIQAIPIRANREEVANSYLLRCAIFHGHAMR